MDKFREEVQKEDEEVMKRKVSQIDQARGFGGKFGVEEDRMDKSAVGHDYQVNRSKYDLINDSLFLICTVIKNLFRHSVEHFILKVKLEKHASQKDYSTGFGGKYGVQEGRKDKVRTKNIEMVQSSSS